MGRMGPIYMYWWRGAGFGDGYAGEGLFIMAAKPISRLGVEIESLGASRQERSQRMMR